MSASNTTSSEDPATSRFFNRRLRRASFITPTGERSKRVFTLREASNRRNDETTPLLNRARNATAESSSKLDAVRNYCQTKAKESWEFWTSRTGLGIFKCSLAYLIGSLATFVPVFSAAIGDKQDSKHMVATVTVWFHAARTIGSMHEATILAFIALCFSGFVCFTSMGISMWFGKLDLLVVGHIIVLVFFIGVAFGFIAWVKQRLGHPLVNVACALASLGCITVLIKEGSVQAGTFSVHRVVQVLLMVTMGIVITTAVNQTVFPRTARTQLTADLQKNTDLLSEMLITITRAFLSGREDYVLDAAYQKLTKELQQSSSSMSKNLVEAKREYWLLGKEKQYDIEANLVECLAGLSQDLGGLRSAAFAQFAFIKEARARDSDGGTTPVRDLSPVNEPRRTKSSLNVIPEAPDEDLIGPSQVAGAELLPPLSGTQEQVSALDSDMNGTDDMFLTFINQLGPPIKSLVYTLKQILDELPFKKGTPPQPGWDSWFVDPPVEVAVNENFRSSLVHALELYRESRNKALETLYHNRAINAAQASEKGGKNTAFNPKRDNTIEALALESSAQSSEVLEDIEEVSACCGHFSFSLLDLGESVLNYLDLLDSLKGYMEEPHRSWTWMMFWSKGDGDERSTTKLSRATTFHGYDEEHDVVRDIPSPVQRADDFADPEKSPGHSMWTYKLYRSARVFRRDDVIFAVKVGIGAALYAMPAFMEETRPFFVHWRGEWGLVSYMAVCCMTIGASNTTTLKRIIGTFLGASLAIVGWLIAADHGDANPWVLGFFGWLVALGCFYIIIAKGSGPMGRFILLTYNLGALYSYSLSVRDDDNDEDEGGVDPAIWEIVTHRMVAVIVGCLWGIIITRFIWPISARKKVKDGLCVLWLRMSLIFKRDPLAMFLLGEPRSSYMDIREEASLHAFLANLDGLRQAATSEFEFKGPFADKIYGRIVERSGRMLSSFHAMNVVISKNLQYTPGEAAVLRYTRQERFELSARISHLFSVLASSVKLEYPLNDALPSIDHTRDRLLGRMSEFRRTGPGRDVVTEQDYELLYAYILVTGQLSQDIQAVSAEIENLFGTLNEENLKLQ